MSIPIGLNSFDLQLREENRIRTRKFLLDNGGQNTNFAITRCLGEMQTTVWIYFLLSRFFCTKNEIRAYSNIKKKESKKIAENNTQGGIKTEIDLT